MSLRALAACLGALAAAGSARAAAPGQAPPRARPTADPVEVARAEEQLRVVADRLALVEREYGNARDESELLQLRKRFGDGETQYLLGEYANAAALLYDVVDSPLVKGEESYPDALLYLADALYQQGSWLEARRYFRELADQRGTHLEAALLALIDLSDKVGDQAGPEEPALPATGRSRTAEASIDELYRVLEQREGPDKLKPQVIYVHAKWLGRRSDLSDADRIRRGLDAFAQIPDGSEFGPQARYFEGALLVQKGALSQAADRFGTVLQLNDILRAETSAQAGAEAKQKLSGVAAVQSERRLRNARIRDLATLALGRIYFEQGQYARAAERYQEIASEAEAYPDALFELSACWLRLGEFERALHTTELLLLLVEDSAIAPDARLQQALLTLRLKQYAKAQQLFEALGDQYRPVRESIDALTRREDPVSYYDDLLQRGETSSLDTTQLLPEVARKYVSGRDVAQARVIVEEISAGRQGLADSREILARLDQAVRKARLELFPTLQEGNLRAVEVENALVRLDGQLAGLETLLVESSSPDIREKLVRAREKRHALDITVAELPDTAARIEERRRTLSAQTAELERAAFRLGAEVESMNAQLAAVATWQKDSAAARNQGALAEREFALQLQRDRAIVQELEAERQELVHAVRLATATAPAAVAGGTAEEKLRADYLAAVAAEQAAADAAQATLTPSQRLLEGRIATALAVVGDMRKRTLAVKASTRRRAEQRLSGLRQRLDREAEALAGYGQSVSGMEGGTRQLLGRIAFESFARVGRIFYDLVLKADVGVIDAAWTQKRERTESITQVATTKERELKSLSDDFGEVLKEIE